MADWAKQIIAINLIVGDLEEALAFYRDAFGLPPQQMDENTVMFRFGETYVFLQAGQHDRADHSPEDVLSLARTGVGQFAVIVEDVDAVRDDLDDRGVALISGPEDREWGMRTLTFSDPAGHTWEIAQRLAT